jgi:DNA-binding LacI/PurR family transcriptional regulator
VLNFSTQRPIVSTGRALQTRSALGFKMDNEYGAYLAVHHLIELGHRHRLRLRSRQQQRCRRTPGRLQARAAGSQPRRSTTS